MSDDAFLCGSGVLNQGRVLLLAATRRRPWPAAMAAADTASSGLLDVGDWLVAFGRQRTSG
ncbi:MAG: hypothetical protein ACSLE6_02925 [Mycobacterium sp.]